jgi:hypothetical protein
MDGTGFSSWAELITTSTDWRIAAAGDFNGDGNADILWQNSSSGLCGFFIMTGTTYDGWVELENEPLAWQIQPE